MCFYFSVCANAERVSCTPYDEKKGEKSVRDAHTAKHNEEQIEDAIHTPVEQMGPLMAMSVACAKWIPQSRALSWFSRSGLLRLQSRVCACLNVRLTY